jgi:hypothetical protein
VAEGDQQKVDHDRQHNAPRRTIGSALEVVFFAVLFFT